MSDAVKETGRSRAFWELARLAWCESPGSCLLVLTAGVLDSAAVIGIAISLGQIAAHLGSRSDGTTEYAVWLGLSVLLAGFAQVFIQAAPRVVAAMVGVRVRERAARASLQPPGLSHLEQSAYLDDLALAMGATGNEMFSVRQGTLAVARVIVLRASAIASALLICRYSLTAAVLLVGSWMVFISLHTSRMTRLASALGEETGSTRQVDYVRRLLSTPAASKEVRIFGLHAWLVDRFEGAWRASIDGVMVARRGDWVTFAIGLPVVVAGHVAAIAWLGHLALTNAIPLSGFTISVAAFAGVMGLPSSLGEGASIANARVSLAKLRDAEHVAASQGTMSIGTVSAAGLPREQITFASVRFAYPDQDRAVFDGLDLDIAIGRSTAIVGVNGAGKSTLTKLLTRLYEPSEGSIKIDDVDVRDLDLASWRDQVAVVHQDFTRFPMTARENIGLGRVDRVTDIDGIRRAAKRAGCLQFIESLPDGWDTVLSREFEDSAELSGGQWQRIAIARALFTVDCGARVLVLDEPTASLDVRSEAEVFNQLLEVTAGLTTILISHRFATVRRADRICVISEGRVAQDGRHDELVQTDGHYRSMFLMQARQFDPTVEVHR